MHTSAREPSALEERAPGQRLSATVSELRHAPYCAGGLGQHPGPCILPSKLLLEKCRKPIAPRLLGVPVPWGLKLRQIANTGYNPWLAPAHLQQAARARKIHPPSQKNRKHVATEQGTPACAASCRSEEATTARTTGTTAKEQPASTATMTATKTNNTPPTTTTNKNDSSHNSNDNYFTILRLVLHPHCRAASQPRRYTPTHVGGSF